MRSRFSFPGLILLVGALALAACGGQAASAEGYGTAELVEDLRAAGAQAEQGETVEQAFFSVSGRFVKVHGEDVQVFEYESAETMESDAVLVDADGSAIGTSMVSWVATPHFFKKGRILVLYVGDNPEALEVLESVLGPQFAGG